MPCVDYLTFRSLVASSSERSVLLVTLILIQLLHITKPFKPQSCSRKGDNYLQGCYEKINLQRYSAVLGTEQPLSKCSGVLTPWRFLLQ